MLKLYCHDRERGEDPHAVIVEIDDADIAKINAAREKDGRIGAQAIGTYVEVTDQATGKRFNVASHPCGAPCHCGCVAIEVT